MEWPAKVHYITRCDKMLEFDIAIMQQLSTSHLFDQNGMQLLETMKMRLFLLKQNNSGSTINSPSSPVSPASSSPLSNSGFTPIGGSTLNNPT